MFCNLRLYDCFFIRTSLNDDYEIENRNRLLSYILWSRPLAYNSIEGRDLLEGIPRVGGEPSGDRDKWKRQ